MQISKLCTYQNEVTEAETVKYTSCGMPQTQGYHFFPTFEPCYDMFILELSNTSSEVISIAW